MTTDSGGNPRFKGSGMLWKTPWKHGGPNLDMDFFTNFFDPAHPLRSWYESTAALGDGWFFGSATPGFTIGGAILLPANFSTATTVAVASRLAVAPSAGWSVTISTTLHLIVKIGLDDGSFITLDGGPITPGIVWPFFIDVYDNATSTTIKLYIPVAGNLANVAASATAAIGVYYRLPLLTTPFLFGLATGATGGDSIYINGLSNGLSILTTGVLSATIIAFFQAVKDTLTLPVLAPVTPDAYVDATLVYPDAPATYTTPTPFASGLTQTFGPGGSATIQNVALTVDFAY